MPFMSIVNTIIARDSLIRSRKRNVGQELSSVCALLQAHCVKMYSSFLTGTSEKKKQPQLLLFSMSSLYCFTARIIYNGVAP